MIEEIPGEFGRFLVQSDSRPDVKHIVDILGDDGTHCSCESSLAHGNKHCKHVQKVLQWFRDIKSQGIKDGLQEPERSEDDPRLEER